MLTYKFHILLWTLEEIIHKGLLFMLVFKDPRVFASVRFDLFTEYQYYLYKKQVVFLTCLCFMLGRGFKFGY